MYDCVLVHRLDLVDFDREMHILVSLNRFVASPYTYSLDDSNCSRLIRAFVTLAIVAVRNDSFPVQDYSLIDQFVCSHQIFPLRHRAIHRDRLVNYRSPSMFKNIETFLIYVRSQKITFNRFGNDRNPSFS